MANTLQLHPSPRWTLNGVSASLRAIARTVAAEHALALNAATKAALPRERLAELRAMYLPTSHPQQEGNGTAQCTRAALVQADIEPPRKAVPQKVAVAAPIALQERSKLT